MEKEITNSKKVTTETTKKITPNDFFCSETGFYQIIQVRGGRVYFEQKTLSQIADILNFANESEKEVFRVELNKNRRIILSELQINYVFVFGKKVETPYILDFENNKITVFVTTNLKRVREGNELWESYLLERFKGNRDAIKQWISAYIFLPEYRYTNNLLNKRLPVKILVGKRGTGKTSYIELLSNIWGSDFYAKMKKETFNGRFDNWKDATLAHLNESAKMNHAQYEKVKETMGSSFLFMEKKGKDIVKIENNLALIIDSNKKNPIYTVLDEIPKDTKNNQFLVVKFKELKEENSNIVKMLEQSFYHYIDTELRTVFENEVVPNMNKMRWVIDTPITKECLDMFLINKTNVEFQIEDIVEVLKSEYLDNNKTFISNSRLDEIANMVKAKDEKYFRNDMIENGILYPKSTLKKINGKNFRGYVINRETVLSLYEKQNSNDNEQDLPIDFDCDFDSDFDNLNDNIFPIAQ